MKPIIFAGDSWTFGEGLELEDSNFRDFSKSFCKKNNIEYHWPHVEDISEGGSATMVRCTHRFPTVVSNHFKTFYISSGINGGDNTYAINYIKPIVEKYGEDSFSYIVLQFTDMFRDLEYHFWNIIKLIDDKDYSEGYPLNNFLSLWNAWDTSDCGLFIENMHSYNKKTNDGKHHLLYDTACKLQLEYKTYENFISGLIISQYKMYYDLLSVYKIPIICIGTWSKEDTLILKKINSPYVDFFTKKMVTLESNGIVSNYLSDLFDFKLNDFPYDNMLIHHQHPWTVNLHPTKKFHKVIADSVIKYIENLENSK